jgi:hypothetical protein
MKRFSPKVLALAVLVALVATAGAIAATGSGSDDHGPTADQVTDPQFRVAKVQAVEPDQAASFSILRRQRTAADEMPASARAMLGNPRLNGKNVDLARAIDTPTGKGWVIPGRGSICVAIPDPVDGYGLGCNTTEDAESGGAISSMNNGRDTRVVVVGLVPDSAGPPEVTFADGSMRALDAPGGVVSAALDDPKSLTFTSSTGVHTVNVSPVRERSISVDCGDGRYVDVDSPKQIGRACD